MKKTIVCFSLLAAIILVMPKGSFGFGMLTEPIVIQDVARGQEITEVLSLVNSEAKPMVYGLTTEGQIANWTSFFKTNDIANPIDKIELLPNSGVDVLAKFVVPNDAPNGTYAGQFVITTIPEHSAAEGASASVSLRIGRDVSITVTDKEVVKLDSQIIPLSYGIAQNKPLEIKLIYDNQGNIALKPDVALKITRAGVSVFEAVFPYPENEQPIKPRERKEVMVNWQSAGQEKGDYDAEIKVLLGDRVMKEDSFSFRVGVVANDFLGFVAKIGGGNLTLAWFLIGLLFVVIALNLALLSKKRFFKKNKK